MGAGNDPRTDDAYEDDRTDERSAYAWMGRGWAIGYGWPPMYRLDDADEPVAGDETDATADREDGGSWWDEALISTLLVAGIALFLFPEPATSMLGIALISIGVLAWLIDAFA